MRTYYFRFLFRKVVAATKDLAYMPSAFVPPQSHKELWLNFAFFQEKLLSSYAARLIVLILTLTLTMSATNNLILNLYQYDIGILCQIV